MIKSPILKSILWTLVLLLFPISSGVITQILKLNTLQTMVVQGCFMILSLGLPAAYVLKAKIKPGKIGITHADSGSLKKALYFLPLVLAEIPFLIAGIHFNSANYLLALGFLTISVGISEEIYFRGIIIALLKEKYKVKRSVLLSALVFGAGHIATAFVSHSLLIVFLSILNAFIFGIVAAEIVFLTKSILPTVLWHAAFDFVNHITAADGIGLIAATGVQIAILLLFAFYLWGKLSACSAGTEKGAITAAIH